MVFLPLFLNSIIPSSAIFKRNADGFTTTTAATTTTTAVTNAAFSTPLAAAFSVVPIVATSPAVVSVGFFTVTVLRNYRGTIISM